MFSTYLRSIPYAIIHLYIKILYTYIMKFMCLLSPNFMWTSSVKTGAGPKFLSEIKTRELKWKGWTFAILCPF